MTRILAAAVLLPTLLLAQDEQADPFEVFEATGFTVGETPTYPSVEIEEIETQGRGLFGMPAMRDAEKRLREDLYDKTGLRISAFYTTIFQQATNGPGRLTAASGDLDLLANWTFLGRGTENFGQIVFDSEYRHAIGPLPASGLAGEIGALQRTTNGFNDRGWVIRNFHYVQRLFGGKLRFVLGRAYPADFAGGHAMQNVNISFVNRAFSYATTVPFPGHGFSAGLSLRPVDWWYVTAAATNAYGSALTNDLPVLTKADFFSFIETGFTPRIGAIGPGRYRFFLWNMDARPGLGRSSDWGFSVIVDQEIGDHWQVFFRHGYAGQATTGIRRSTETGVGYRDFLGARGNLAGLAFAWSEPASGAPPEKILEGFVRFQLTSFCQLTVGTQGIFDPANSPDQAAAVFTGRVRVAF